MSEIEQFLRLGGNCSKIYYLYFFDLNENLVMSYYDEFYFIFYNLDISKVLYKKKREWNKKIYPRNSGAWNI